MCVGMHACMSVLSLCTHERRQEVGGGGNSCVCVLIESPYIRWSCTKGVLAQGYSVKIDTSTYRYMFLSSKNGGLKDSCSSFCRRRSCGKQEVAAALVVAAVARTTSH